jgi:hypothetical protein
VGVSPAGVKVVLRARIRCHLAVLRTNFPAELLDVDQLKYVGHLNLSLAFLRAWGAASNRACPNHPSCRSPMMAHAEAIG